MTYLDFLNAQAARILDERAIDRMIEDAQALDDEQVEQPDEEDAA